LVSGTKSSPLARTAKSLRIHIPQNKGYDFSFYRGRHCTHMRTPGKGADGAFCQSSAIELVEFGAFALGQCVGRYDVDGTKVRIAPTRNWSGPSGPVF